MAKYKVVFHWSDGTVDEDDNVFNSKEKAYEYGEYALGCCRLGGEILEMSNPGDYPFDESDYEDDDFEIIKVE